MGSGGSNLGIKTRESRFYCFGWSDHVVTFIANSIDGYGDLVERVYALE